MKITDEMLEELISDDGHIGFMKYSGKYEKIARREGTIKALKDLKVKNVIHIGCCGHLKNIKKQIESKSSFHLMLVDSFEKVIGFDIIEDAVKYLSDFVDNVYAKDVTQDVEDVQHIIDNIFGDEPYAILVPEVLEHIPNPVNFLENIVNNYGGSRNPIVVSVPNAYGFGRICSLLFHNVERINMDHKYMFTPTTILKVMQVAGITPLELRLFDFYKLPRLFKNNVCANTILVVGEQK